MDHKVSKDMISSGMIPSGEKTQADLGRTQYGSAPSPSSLADAYKSIYEHHQKDKDGNTIPHEGEEVKEENINELKTRTMLDYIDKASDSASKELGKAEKTTSRKKEVKARLKMDKRERGIEMAKNKIMKRVKEDKKEVKEGYATAAKVALNLVKNMAKKKVVQDIGRGAMTQLGASAVGNAMSGNQKQQKQSGGTISASADLFDIVKGRLLDEGLSEEEIRDIMLTLTPDEILKEIEESSLSAGSSGGHYSDGGDGVFRSKEDVARKFNKNFPPKKNGKVDVRTRSAINTSARDFGIQGPTTVKDSHEPEGKTI